MPRYEFRCRECSRTFEVNRPMSASGDPAPCPEGHPDTVKLLSTVAVGGRATAGAVSTGPARAGGGCCGGACGCG
ncbi:MAG TPA: zinc ribbon domain-containing protein [Pseudonocardia sp.]|nr:zinc ribbon domain-containing protein [Pseudonocardia sp.]